MPIKILLLPDRKTIILDNKDMTVKELLEKLEIEDMDSIALIVNNKLIEDQHYVVRGNDKIIIIQQSIGG